MTLETILYVAIFAVAAAAVWWAGTTLSRDADALAEATGLGRVFIGALLLGVATSLPEVATTITAGVVDNPRLATGNLMGGVAAQVAVLAIADLIESDQRLMFQVSKPSVLLQHVFLLLLLAVAIGAMVVGELVVVGGVGAWPILLALLYLGTMVIVRRYEGRDVWEVADGGPRLGRGGDTGHAASEANSETAVRPPTLRLVGLGAVILVAGWVLATSGDTLAERTFLSDTFVGAAFVAVATSLPEVSTVIGSLRAGAYDMAVANIMGTNGLEVALLAVADAAYRRGAILDAVDRADVFLASLAAVLTCIYLAGLLLRRQPTVLRVGYDSAAVLVVYVAGLAVVAGVG